MAEWSRVLFAGRIETKPSNASLSLLQHLDRFDDSILPRFFLFCIIDPCEVFFLMHIRQLLEGGFGFLIRLKHPLQLRRDNCHALLDIQLH